MTGETVGGSAGPALQCLISSLVLAADPVRQSAAADYWDMSRAAHGRVGLLVAQVVDELARQAPEDADRLAAALRRLRDEAVGPREVGDLLAAWQAGRAAAGAPQALLDDAERAAQDADALGRLAVHIGTASEPVAVVTAEEVGRMAPPPRSRPPAPGAGDAQPDVCVVVPFRDRTGDRSRLRNLLACLAALDDQSVARGRYRVVVVEADREPWAGQLVEPWCDRYVPLVDAGRFNKAWAVNVGVVQAAGDARVLCLLDADILVDRNFVERNLARFGQRGAQAHQPFLDALCCDGETTGAAVLSRVRDGDAAADPARLSGVVLRRPPGHCVWIRREVFDRVKGFDERFVGWGGEDLDFVFRVQVVAGLDRYDDPLVHLHHERPQTHENGVRFYAGRRLLSWAPDGSYGRFDGPATSREDGLADLITRA